MGDELDYLQLQRVNIGDNSMNGKGTVVIESGVV